MNAGNYCPKCQRTMPSDGPPGLCPACLLAVGLGLPVNPQDQNPSPAQTTPSGRQSPPPAVSDLSPLFPQLEIIEILGQGGMGTVYKARQKKLDRLVALKIVRSDAAADPAFAERFNREARTLARMSHPNIVAVHDFGEVQMAAIDAGTSQPWYYFVMEFVDGANLRQLMNGQRLESQQALTIVPQVCDALQYAHDEGVVHRDIKPENILVDHRGRVKIADFGLAKLVAGSSDDFTLTGTHQVMGTPRYMAPEQMEGSDAVDHRADIYSLGVVFYEMLTGQVPAGHFDPPSHKVNLDHRFDSIVLKAMARDPDRRFQRASEVRTEVEGVRLSPELRSEASIVDPGDVAGIKHRPSPQTASEFLSYAAVAAAGWFAATPKSVKRIPLTIRWLPPLLCVATILTLFQPWLTTYITDPHAIVGAHLTRPAPVTMLTAVYREFAPADIALGAVTAFVLAGLLILHLITIGGEAPRRSMVIVRLLLGLYVLGVLLAFRYETGQTYITVYTNPLTGEAPVHILGSVDAHGRATARLQDLEQVTRFTPWAMCGFASMIGLLAINAFNLPSAITTKPKLAVESAKNKPIAMSPFQLASRLLIAVGAVMLFVAVGGLVGMLTIAVTSQPPLEDSPLVLGIHACHAILGTFVFVSGRRIRRGEWINISRVACIMVIFSCSVTMPVTTPLAIWCLVLLSRIRQDYDFETGKTTLRVVQTDGSSLLVPQQHAPALAGNEIETPLGMSGDILPVGHQSWLSKILHARSPVESKTARDMLLEIRTGNVTAVTRLLEQGVDPDKSTAFEHPPLVWAVCKGDTALIELLLKYGADVDIRSQHGVTPLMVASLKGDISIVRLLIQHGADLDLQDSVSGNYAIWTTDGQLNWPGKKMTPLMLAASQGHQAVVEELLNAGADSDVRNW